MAEETVDAVVIGMGVAGEDVAGRLAAAGLSVAGVEAELVGGECAYWACVPTKMMVRSAGLLAEGRRVPGMAGGADVTPDWSPVAGRIREEATADWNDRPAVDRFTARGGRFIRGNARLTGPGTVRVSGPEPVELTARRAIVLAVGGRPRVPPIPGLADTPYWTNRGAVATTEAPESLCVLGGGPVGLEFAQIFARFGSDVTVIEVADRLLGGEEPEVGELLADVLERQGVRVHTGARTHRVEHDGHAFLLDLDAQRVRARRLLVATGREPDLSSLGLDAVGLDPRASTVEVDDHLRAGPGLWAVGDVTGKAMYTHVGTYQAGIAAADILGEPGGGAEYHATPRVTFTDPEVGAVGMTEARARMTSAAVRTGTVRIPATPRGWIHKAGNEGLVKLVEDADSGVLLGATSMGPMGGEVLGVLAVAVHAGVTTGRLREMMYGYPTFHRAIEAALGNLTAPE